MTLKTVSGNYNSCLELDVWQGGGMCALILFEFWWGAPRPGAQ